MFEPDEILWGSPPGPGPALRNALQEQTNRANRPGPGMWFFKVILLSFFILLPLFIIWSLPPPQTLTEFSYGPHPIVSPLTRPRIHRLTTKRPHALTRRTNRVRTERQTG